MKHFWIVRFIWISNMVISIAVTTGSVTQNLYYHCRPIDECLDEIRSNSKNFKFVAIFSSFESSDGITINKCCTLKNTESYNSKKIDVDTLQYTTAPMKPNRVQSSVTDTTYSNDFETDVTRNLINNFPHTEKIIPSSMKFVKTDTQSLFIPVENVKYVQPLRDNIDSNPRASKREIHINENKKYSPHVRQLINEAANVRKTQINPQNRRSDILKERLTMTNVDSAQPNVNINNRGVTDELLKFDESVDEINTRYEKQSMVSSSMSKDVPTTPAVNSFEQKIPSETFLSLDRISTQAINKNTPTNKSEASRNDDDISVFTIVKRSMSFSENTRKNQRFATRKINWQLIPDSRNKLQEETNLREFPVVESTVEIIPMPGRDDPLQASTRNKRMTALIVSQKDILKKNIEEAEYKNNTTQEKNTKPSLRNNRSEVTVNEERKGSANENATKNPVNVTATLPVQRFRFPSKFLSVRFKPRREKHNSTSKFLNLDRFSSSHFQRFYEAKKDMLSKINNMISGKVNSTRFEILSKASQIYLFRMRNNKKALKNSEEKDYALDIGVKSNISALDDSISINKNYSYEYSTPILQNASLASNKIAAHSHISSEKIEKSMQTKAMYNNDTSFLIPEDNSKISSEIKIKSETKSANAKNEWNKDLFEQLNS